MSVSGGAASEADVREAFVALQNGAFLLDVRTESEHAAVHVDGSILIPLQQLARSLGQLPVDRPIYVMCRSGHRSSIAVQQLAAKHLYTLLNVRGGISAWIAAGLPVECPTPPERGFWSWFKRR